MAINQSSLISKIKINPSEIYFIIKVQLLPTLAIVQLMSQDNCTAVNDVAKPGAITLKQNCLLGLIVRLWLDPCLCIENLRSKCPSGLLGDLYNKKTLGLLTFDSAYYLIFVTERMGLFNVDI